MAKDAFVLSVEGGVAVKAADAGDLGGRGPVPQKSLGIEGALFADVLLETDAEVLAKAMNDPGGADKVACGERSCRVLLGGMLVDVVQNDLQGLVVTDGLNRLGAFAVAEKEQERVEVPLDKNALLLLGKPALFGHEPALKEGAQVRMLLDVVDRTG